MSNKFLVFFLLVALSFTRSNPYCDHSNHNRAAFKPVHSSLIVEAEMVDLIPNDVPTIPIGFTIQSKDTLTWKVLNQLEYVESEHPSYGTVMMPVFSKVVSAFDKKRVIIKGYILPVDRKTYALSKNVYAACFFCGKAGPETVMGLTFKQPPGRIKMDTYATLSGILKLNGTDVEDWMYSLTDVEIIQMKE
ncbi:MAG: hypothetical protein WAT79_15205 [Saprospiraceae bacterium]